MGLIQDIKPRTKVSIGGKVRRNKVTVRLIFTVNGVEYAGTQRNRELIDTYLHTGDGRYLTQLEGGKQ